MAEAVIRFSDILSCLSGSIDHLLEANRYVNGTDLHTSCLCGIVITVVKVPVYYKFHRKMMFFICVK